MQYCVWFNTRTKDDCLRVLLIRRDASSTGTHQAEPPSQVRNVISIVSLVKVAIKIDKRLAIKIDKRLLKRKAIWCDVGTTLRVASRTLDPCWRWACSWSSSPCRHISAWRWFPQGWSRPGRRRQSSGCGSCRPASPEGASSACCLWRLECKLERLTWPFKL